MNVKQACVLWLAGICAVAAQTPSPSRLEGRVATLSGDGIRSATVTLQASGKPGITASSDNDGKFTFEEISPGRYQLSANKAGFLSQAYGQRSARGYGAPFTLEAGETLKDVVISLTPQSVITGRVLDRDGDPVAGVQVRTRPVASLPQQPPDLLTGGTTDDQGNFRLAGLDPGHYYLIAMPPVRPTGERPSRRGAGMALVTTYYPGVLNQASAKTIELTPGADFRGADIPLRLERVYAIRGTITGSPSAVIFARDVGADVVSVIGGPLFQSSPDGSFEVRNLVPGDYRIYASSGTGIQLTGAGWSFGRGVPGRNNSEATKLASLEVRVANSDVEGVVLPLASGVEVTGTIRADDDALPSGRPIGLRAIEGFALNAIPATVDKTGAFQLTGVQPSKYLLAIPIKPGTYVESARLDNSDVTHTPLDLTKGGGSIEIVLSAKVASITATVHDSDGAPVPGMLAALWPKELEAASSTGGTRVRIADQKGELHFTDLPPGEYYLVALEGLEPRLAEERNFLSHFTSEAAIIALQQGAEEKLNLTPVSPDKIADVLSKVLNRE